MKANVEFKFPYLLVGIGLGAIAGMLLAPRSGEETRKYLRERRTKGLDILNQQAGKLRASAEGMVQKGKDILSRQCCDSVDADTEAQKQADQEQRRATFGGIGSESLKEAL